MTGNSPTVLNEVPARKGETSEVMKGRARVKSWVITGGVACGKSTVIARIQERLGEATLSTFSCDEAVRRSYDEPDVVKQVLAKFGKQVVRDGVIDRAALGAVVFKDREARKALEALLHPPVLAALEASRRAAQASATVKLFVAEVPLYHEIGGTVAADHVIVVASSPSQQVRRLMHNRGLDKARSESMVEAQWPVLDKAVKATQVIWNDGSEEALDDQISTLLTAFDPT